MAEDFAGNYDGTCIGIGQDRMTKLTDKRQNSRRAFTLMEVMIAVGILFMCLFAVLALLSNSLRSARMLQQHRTVDTATIAGLLYVQLANTNQVSEGEQRIDLEDLYPG